jgi:hypothetical protein
MSPPKNQNRRTTDWKGVAAMIAAVIGAVGFILTTVDRYGWENPLRKKTNKATFEYIQSQLDDMKEDIQEIKQGMHGTHHTFAARSRAAIPRVQYEEIQAQVETKGSFSPFEQTTAVLPSAVSAPTENPK